MKKSILIGSVMTVAMVMVSTSSFAAVYESLRCKRATANPSGVTKVMLETTTDTKSYTWYTAPSGSDDQTLAIALTAISMGSKVRVGKDSASSTALLEIGLDNAGVDLN